MKLFSIYVRRPLASIIELKKNWLVSAIALIVRMKNIGAITEWQYRTLIVEASQAGLKIKEIEGISRESSLVIYKILSVLATQGITLVTLAKKLNLPLEEISNLIFKFGVISNEHPNITHTKKILNLKLL